MRKVRRKSSGRTVLLVGDGWLVTFASFSVEAQMEVL